MNIAVLDDYAGLVRTLESFSKVAAHDVTIWNDHTRDTDALSGRLRDAEALVLLRERTPITGALVERLPRLKVISQNGPGPHIDVATCTRKGVVVCCNLHSRASYATAELAWGLVIASLRHLPEEIARLKGGGWQRTVGTVMHGLTLGIYGYGRIGKQVAGFGRAFGMEVLAWSRERGRAAARADGYQAAAGGRELFERSDVLSVHYRLTPESRGIITAADLACMKPSALFVNVSRADLVETDALVSALRAGRPGRAAVDVFEEEPVVGGHPLLEMDNVLCTPHLGYMAREQMELYYSDVFDQVLAFAAGKPVNVVNPEVLQGR